MGAAEWVQILATAFVSIVGALGGGSIIFYRQNKRLKETEVIKNQSDEWQELYHDLRGEKEKLSDKIEHLYKERNELQKQITSLQLKVQQLHWYRCEVENCKKRMPPHFYTSEGNEIVAAQSQEKQV